MANRPLTRTEWMASLAEDIDKFDWSGEGNKRWVGLTDDEVKGPIQRAMQHFGFDPTQYSLGGAATIGFLGLAKEIEAKLREKNT